GPRPVAAHRERDLLVRSLTQEIPAGILEQVAGATAPLHAPDGRLEQARRELPERGLAGPVRAHQRHDLASPQLELGAVEHPRPPGVCKADAVDPARELAK